MSDIAPELVERMVRLVRRVAAELDYYHGYAASAMQVEGRAIVAELPAPVDPDLIEARKLTLDSVPTWDEADEIKCMRGDFDSNLFIVIALAAIKRGRELALCPTQPTHLGERVS